MQSLAQQVPAARPDGAATRMAAAAVVQVLTAKRGTQAPQRHCSQRSVRQRWAMHDPAGLQAAAGVARLAAEAAPLWQRRWEESPVPQARQRHLQHRWPRLAQPPQTTNPGAMQLQVRLKTLQPGQVAGHP